MNSPTVQRWRERRDTYRPAGEPIAAHRYGVEVLPERDARAFVVGHHYSASFPAARVSVGLFRSRGAFWAAELVGVATFSVGVQHAGTMRRWCSVGPDDGVELGRFVLLDDVEANGETWFLRRAFDALVGEIPNVRAVLAYSDPIPRTTIEGVRTLPGHVGNIYQAFNGRFVGRSSRRILHLDPAGRVVNGRTLTKIRKGESGAGPAVDALVRAGAPAPRHGEDPSAWVRRALTEGPFRRLPHPGNYAYVWPVGHAARAAARALPKAAGPYPKLIERAA